MDKIFIHDLRVEARIGVYDWERHLPQTIRLDLELGAPSSLPFKSGRIADALDYAKVVERLKAFAKDAPPPLLERFAEKVAQMCSPSSARRGCACAWRSWARWPA